MHVQRALRRSRRVPVGLTHRTPHNPNYPAPQQPHHLTQVMSMEDIVKRRLALHDARALRTPTEVLALLKAGNARFWSGQAKVSTTASP